MKVLHLEDSIDKYVSIRSVLKSVGVTDVIRVESVEAGMEYIDNPNESFNVIISDMHFPLKSGGPADGDAGEEVIKEIQKRGLDIPIIIISSMRLRVPEAHQCIWYVESRDWESDLRNCIKALSK